jgi:DNA polymerase (family 10)
MALPPPEVREDQGEIEAALRGQVPTLVELKDIKGDLHVHTNASDGSHNMEDMARAAMDRGYQYVGISDHSGSLRIANGLDEGRLKKNIAEAARLSEKTLSDLDYVIGAVHSRFKMSESEMTVRLLTALSNEHISILAHPTGRLIGQREPYSFDTEQVFHRARESSVFLEVNAFPERMDLNDGYCRIAKERGNQLVISTDSHGPSHLDNIVYGLAMARRGWIGPEQVINTLPLNDIIVLLDH